MKFIKILVIILPFFICLDVYAADACTASEMNRLRELANNVKFKTTSNVEMDDKENEIYDVYYNAQAINLVDDLKIVYQLNEYKEEVTIYKDQEILDIFYPGQTVKFKVYAYTENLCIDELVKTITVKFPYVNKWYHFHQEKCEQYPEFEYCKEDLDISRINYENIDGLLEEYIEESKSIFNSLGKINNLIWYIVGGAAGIIIIITITIIILKRRKKEESI